MSKGIGLFWGALVIAVIALGLLRLKPLVMSGDAPTTQISDQPGTKDPVEQPRGLTHEPTILQADSATQPETGSPLESPWRGGSDGRLADEASAPVRTSSDIEFLPIPALDNPIQR